MTFLALFLALTVCFSYFALVGVVDRDRSALIRAVVCAAIMTIIVMTGWVPF